MPAGRFYLDFSDFTLWVLAVRRVRWVGGYGRMDSATGEQYAAASPDPVGPASARALAHLNADHGPAPAAIARAFGGYPDTDAAVCTGVDRYGLDLRVHTPRGVAHTRVGFPWIPLINYDLPQMIWPDLPNRTPDRVIRAAPPISAPRRCCRGEMNHDLVRPVREAAQVRRNRLRRDVFPATSSIRLRGRRRWVASNSVTAALALPSTARSRT